MRKIVFFNIQIFDKRNHDRYGLQKFYKKKWKIEYWELTKLQKKNFKRYYNFKCNYVKVRKFENFFSLLRYILGLKESFFFVDQTKSFKYGILSRLLTLKKCKRVVVKDRWSGLNLYGYASFAYECYRFFESIYFRPLNIIKVPKIFFLRVIDFISSYLIYPKSSLSSNFGETRNKKFNFTNHNYDYNIFLKFNKKNKSKKNNNHIVFIDQGFPMPVDRELKYQHSQMNKKMCMDETDYWDKINSFLNDLKKKYKKKVIIAANPRSKLNKKLIKFEIIYGKTADLINRSFLVITHGSLAIQFAILWNKPIMCITMKNLPASAFIDAQYHSKKLDLSVVDLNDYLIKDVNFKKVNKIAYEKFKTNYIYEKKLKDESSWDVIIRKLDLYIREKKFETE